MAARIGETGEFAYPVVKFVLPTEENKGMYYNTKWGKNFYNPLFEIVGWMTEGEVSGGGDAEKEEGVGRRKRSAKRG